jgi:ribonucleotide reductase beta subunit family protein with ferritin-like domain
VDCIHLAQDRDQWQALLKNERRGVSLLAE